MSSEGISSSPQSPQKKKEEEAGGKLLKREWVQNAAVSEQVMRSFKVMQFNILADGLAHSGFSHCPPEALKWDARGPLLLQEIIRSGADIVCLEEIDHFADFFEPELSSRGFEGLFVEKIDSPCLLYTPNNGPDGCAIFYRTAKFGLLEKKEIILKNKEGKESHQVALLAKLNLKELVYSTKDKSQPSEKSCGTDSPVLCVAVAHLKAKPEGRELRTAQGRHLTSEVSSFAGSSSSVIVCGDFNATNDEPVYEHFTSHEEHPDLKLASSYIVPHYGNKEPPFTSWKFRAKGEAKYAIDYIWYTPDDLKVNSVWAIPSEEDIGNGGLPCANYPSDHVALCSSFCLKIDN